MNGLCHWIPLEAKSAAIELSRGIHGAMNAENRQNRVLSPFCGQQEISDSRDYGSSVIVGCSFFRRGSHRNASGLLLLAPHPPPYKTRFWGWREILAASFSGYFFNNRLFFKS